MVSIIAVVVATARVVLVVVTIISVTVVWKIVVEEEGGLNAQELMNSVKAA